MKTVKIGGVPEHFNMPWHHAIGKGYFKEAGIDLKWNNYRSGSAPLAIDMDNGELDLSVILTESIIKSIVMDGHNSLIASIYVDSPLIWGIHTGYDNLIKTSDDMLGKKYAISRFGSGSHLMSIVDAENRKLKINNEQFVVVNNLIGAVESLSKCETDIFFWEKFTTKPWVDNKTFRLIDTCPTPWSSFVIAGNKDFLNNNKETVSTIIDIVQRSAEEFRNREDANEIIAEQYSQKIGDVKQWFDSVSWSKNKIVSKSEIEKVIKCLLLNGIIDHEVNVNNLIYEYNNF
jgi:ABC-type nitrate/sulfonate/bicarbonate transport system substrate-binding protein